MLPSRCAQKYVRNMWTTASEVTYLCADSLKIVHVVCISRNKTEGVWSLYFRVGSLEGWLCLKCHGHEAFMNRSTCWDGPGHHLSRMQWTGDKESCPGALDAQVTKMVGCHEYHLEKCLWSLVHGLWRTLRCFFLSRIVDLMLMTKKLWVEGHDQPPLLVDLDLEFVTAWDCGKV